MNQRQSTPRILIVDDEKAICDILSASLKDDGFEVDQAADGNAGLAKVKSFDPDIVLLDIWMPGLIDGLDVLQSAKTEFPEKQFIIMSGHGTIETAVKAVRLGAWDFVEKPLSMDKISILIQNILAFQIEQKEKNNLLNRLKEGIALVGDGQEMKTIKQMVARIAPTDSWVLISGEKGSGRSLVGQNLHYASSRASQNFVDFNCSLVMEELQEIELFGCSQGVLPGTEGVRKGRVDVAHQGTLFLDEVTNLSQVCQEKILRILQDRRFQRFGGEGFVESNIRVIASTTEDLKQVVKRGNFREDLYYRLSQVHLKLSSLKDRREDIPALVDHFSSWFAKESAVKKKALSPDAMGALQDHTWPGNIRELRNFIERLYILSPGEEIQLHDLQFAGLSILDSFGQDFSNFREARSQFEKEFLLQKIQQNNGNISKTAESIGLERSYLHRKIKAFGIDIGGGDRQL